MKCEFTDITEHFTKILRHGGAHEADGAVRWTHVLTLMEDAEQIPYWNKGNWIDALSRSSDKARVDNCEDQNGTIIRIRALQGHSHGVVINPNLFSLKQIPLNWKEHMYHTGSSSNYKSLQKRTVDWQQDSVQEAPDKLPLSSESARIVIATAYDLWEWTR